MNGLFQTTLALLSGACLYSAVHYVWLGAHKPRSQHYLWFALLNLIVGLYILAKLSAYHAVSAEELVSQRRLEVSAAIFFFASLPWFVVNYCDSKHFRLPAIITLVWLLIFFSNWLMPYGVAYYSLPELKFITLPWGEQIADLHPHRGMVLTTFFMFIFFNFAWYGYFCVQQFRQGNQRATTLVFALLILLSGIIFNFLVNNLLLPSPQLAEFGFIAMILLMNSRLNHELRASRDELMQSEARFRLLVEQARDAIYLHDVSGVIVDVNQQACADLGYSRHELLGMNVSYIETEVSTERAREIWNAMQPGVSVTVEGQHRRKDGSVFPVEVRVGLFHSNGRDLALAIARNTSERKQAELALQTSEQRLRATLDNTPGVAVQWYDRDGRVLYWNSASEKLYAIPASQAIGKTLQELLLTPEQFNEFRASILQIEQQHSSFGPAELEVQSFNGKKAIVLYTMFMIPGNQNQSVFVCMDVDITQHKRTEAELINYRGHLEELVEQRTRQLEAANKEIESFSYSVSHDLRAPLRAIDGFASALEEEAADCLNDEARDHLKRIRSSIQRMRNLIDGLLELSRCSREALHPVKLNLGNMARDIILQLRANEPQRKANIQIAPDLNATGDARLMEIALTNLFSNAWKYTSRKPEATIEFGQQHMNDETVFFIRDNGTGFDMRYVNKLFGAFQRLHGSDFPGSGIGLTTVQRIIQRHGGRIWAEADPDKGATFYFILGRPA